MDIYSFKYILMTYKRLFRRGKLM